MALLDVRDVFPLRPAAGQSMKRPLFLLLSLLLLGAAAGAEPPSVESRLAAMDSAVRSAQSAGDNA